MPNLSFELPGGNPATILSGNSEPFGLSDGDSLVIETHDGEQTINLDAADFADIGAATAVELESALNEDLVGVTATAVAGAVQLSTDDLGDEATIQLTGGSGLIALGLDNELHAGETNPGAAADWSLDATGIAAEVAPFDSADFLQAVEDFEDNWGSGDDTDGLDDTEIALFNDVTGPTTFDGFKVGWGTVLLGHSAAEAAAFDDSEAVSGTETHEDFETWTGSPEPIYTLLNGGFDSGAEAEDDFTEGWHAADLSGLGSTEAASFDDAAPEAFEDFEEATTIAWIVTIDLTADGQWTVDIDGHTASYVASGDSEPAIAVALASRINLLDVPVTAVSNVADVEITHENPGIAFAVEVHPPADGGATRSRPAQDLYWTGDAHLPS